MIETIFVIVFIAIIVFAILSMVKHESKAFVGIFVALSIALYVLFIFGYANLASELYIYMFNLGIINAVIIIGLFFAFVIGYNFERSYIYAFVAMIGMFIYTPLILIVFGIIYISINYDSNDEYIETEKFEDFEDAEKMNTNEVNPIFMLYNNEEVVFSRNENGNFVGTNGLEFIRESKGKYYCRSEDLTYLKNSLGNYDGSDGSKLVKDLDGYYRYIEPIQCNSYNSIQDDVDLPDVITMHYENYGEVKYYRRSNGDYEGTNGRVFVKQYDDRYYCYSIDLSYTRDFYGNYIGSDGSKFVKNGNYYQYVKP